ncbi:type II secretion system F family protein [Paraburkholderia sediminicola]|uniref:type II secretion system F family protein n=1 Tax=Paraburkholderia sediminicola TaxID=458836 RepID=UPI0038BD182D
MYSPALLAAALALLCAAGAILVIQLGARRNQHANTKRFINSRMTQAFGARGATAASSGEAALPKATHKLRAHVNAQTQVEPKGWRALKARATLALDETMHRAGISHAIPLTLCAVVCSLALSLLAGARGGAGAFAMTLAMCALLLCGLLSRRMLKRRQKIVSQLPSFLDGVVRLIVLGNSVPAAFQASLLTTETPLRQCLDHVSRMLRAGIEIDRALSHVARVYRTSELELLGAVLRLSVKYGGRADVMLDRMAAFMRDLEQAERELAAMSAETRLSGWVLTVLPLGIGGFLFASDPHYLAWMWNDASGRHLLYLALALQICGGCLLHRLARLKG